MSSPLPRKLKGIVVSDKMNKTAVVEVAHLRMHPKYKKYQNISKRYKVHDETNAYKVGDQVIIKETRPISKEKRWTMLAPAPSSKSQAQSDE